MALSLGSVTEDVLQIWFQREAVVGKHQAARALRMFRGYLRWCAARPEYRSDRLCDQSRQAAPHDCHLSDIPVSIKAATFKGIR